MKLLFIYTILFFAPGVTWLGDFNTAKIEAAQKHKLILINFRDQTGVAHVSAYEKKSWSLMHL